MSASFNRVILMGNLTRDPELRYTRNQMAVCKVGLAVNRRYKDSASGEWREEPTFVDVTIFGKRGEAFHEHHGKGATAFVEGTLRLDQWDDKNGGGKRSKLYVVADSWEFVGGARGEGQGGGNYSGQGSSGQSSSGQGGRSDSRTAEAGAMDGGSQQGADPEYQSASDDVPF
jgi:single-strand DNA-binding protein